MPRARNIKYGFFQNEDLTEIDFAGRLLFIGLWTLADRDGRLEDRPKQIKMQLFPADDCHVEHYLSELERYGFITRYQVAGHRYLLINNFSKHQSPHKAEKASTIPPADEQAQKLHDKNDASSKQAPGEHPKSRPDCLIADSLKEDYLNPESGKLIENSGNKTLSRASASEGEAPPTSTDKHSIQKVFAHWQSIMMHPKAKLDDKRKRLIRHALKLGYSIQELCEAIEGCSKTPHNIGQNDKGQRYDGLHIILKDADQIDRFIHNCHTPPKCKTKADIRQAANLDASVEWATEKLGGEHHVH